MTLRRLLLICAAVCGGCAGDDGPLVVVGRAGPRQSIAETEGQLIVETKTQMILDGDVPRYPHTGYDLLTNAGHRIRYVWNRLSDQDETPQVVSLSPGTYIVRPDGSPRSAVYEVTIAAGHTTVLDLDEQD